MTICPGGIEVVCGDGRRNLTPMTTLFLEAHDHGTAASGGGAGYSVILFERTAQ